MDRFTPSRAPVKRVKAIQLGVWDPEEIVSPSPSSLLCMSSAPYAEAAMDSLSIIQPCWHRMLEADIAAGQFAATDCLLALCTRMLSCCMLFCIQKKYSVCHVESPELFEKQKPKAGGLSDPRMGTMDKFGGICTTDGANMHDCPGYFGHIELAEPVYHCE